MSNEKSEGLSEARDLWDDVCTLMQGSVSNASVTAMLKSCDVIGMDDQTLTISTDAKFVKRTLDKYLPDICRCLESAAFRPMDVNIELGQPRLRKIDASPTISEEDLARSQRQRKPQKDVGQPHEEPIKEKVEDPLVSVPSDNDSKLTFDTFVEGEENQFALQAAKGVANGTKDFNPLFIFGRSGLGKTHLLKAIQNYIYANDPTRSCVYKTASDFISDYTDAMVNTEKTIRDSFSKNYQNIDVLIIDDIQNLRSATRTVDFFFDTFNHLIDHGKQIVLAADVPPIELGMDERVSSRIASGMSVPIQPPNYELKLALIKSFYSNMKEEGLSEYQGTIEQGSLELMAERSGSNIRLIKSFCQNCLFEATTWEKKGRTFTREDVIRLARINWGANKRIVSVEEIQKAVENQFSISHTDLIGNKRNKELMEPRHIAIWLTRNLTDETLAEIGRHFGGRTHATVKHSIGWVDAEMKQRKVFYDLVDHLKEQLVEDV
ncbi:MAG: DnaA/Hda family protein [Atopobiaceae bacterium]|jgi:chromosomal replication initiator protein|nr:DnaA/Hda family protein [Atopobiaceae bacterium]MCI1226276.1 DnaA/Hda family protein [Atopobiaceae bacterium]